MDTKTASKYLSVTLQYIFPEICPACGNTFPLGSLLCQDCHASVYDSEKSSACPTCGNLMSDGECQYCKTREVFYSQKCNGGEYSGARKALFRLAKFHKSRKALSLLKPFLFAAIEECGTSGNQILLPVPSRHNLVRTMVREWKLIQPDIQIVNALKKKARKKEQKQKERRDRFAELLGSFTLEESLSPDKQYILVDDVATTGATLNEIARTLHEEAGIPRENIRAMSLLQNRQQSATHQRFL